MKSKDLALGRETINHKPWSIRGSTDKFSLSACCLLPAVGSVNLHHITDDFRLATHNMNRDSSRRVSRVSQTEIQNLSLQQSRETLQRPLYYAQDDRQEESTQARRLTHGTDGGGKESRILPHEASGGPCRCRYLSLERVATARTVVTRPVRTFPRELGVPTNLQEQEKTRLAYSQLNGEIGNRNIVYCITKYLLFSEKEK